VYNGFRTVASSRCSLSERLVKNIGGLNGEVANLLSQIRALPKIGLPHHLFTPPPQFQSGAWQIMSLGRLTSLSVEFPFDPIFTEELNRVLSSNSSVTAAKVISSTQLLTPPAKTLWVFRIQRYSDLSHT